MRCACSAARGGGRSVVVASQVGKQTRPPRWAVKERPVGELKTTVPSRNSRSPSRLARRGFQCVVSKSCQHAKIQAGEHSPQEPSVSPPGDLAPGESPAEGDSGDGVPEVVASPTAATVWVDCAPASPECRNPRIF